MEPGFSWPRADFRQGLPVVYPHDTRIARYPYLKVPGIPSLALAVGNRQITASWQAGSGGDEADSWIVQWKASGQSYSTSRQATVTSLSHLVQNLTGFTQYTFRVRGTNAAGSGSWSAEVSGVPYLKVPGIPSLALAVGNRQITASWQAGSGGDEADSWIVQWKASGQSYSTSRQATVTSLSHLVQNLTGFTQYTFRVRGTNAAGSGSWSAEVSGVPYLKVPGIPSLALAVGNRQITASWQAGSGGDEADSWIVQWKASGQSYSTSRQATVTSLSHLVQNLTGFTQYTFRVRGTNAAGSGSWSAEVSGVPYLKVPGIPSLALAVGNRQITASWQAGSGGDEADSWIVQWKASGQSYSTSRQATVTSLSHLVQNLTGFTQYTFRVRGTNAAGSGSWSAEVSGVPYLKVPGIPSLALAVGNRQITASWQAGSGGDEADSWIVQWKASGQSYSTSRQATVTSLSHLVQNLTGFTQYTFRVRGTNAAGSGSWSAEVSGVPYLKVPGIPSLALAVGNRQITASWQAGSGGDEADSWIVQWKAYGQSYSTSRQATVTSLSHLVQNLTDFTQYTFRVRGTNAAGSGSWSAEVSGVPGGTELVFHSSATFVWPWADRTSATIVLVGGGGGGGGDGGGGGGQAWKRWNDKDNGRPGVAGQQGYAGEATSITHDGSTETSLGGTGGASGNGGRGGVGGGTVTGGMGGRGGIGAIIRRNRDSLSQTAVSGGRGVKGVAGSSGQERTVTLNNLSVGSVITILVGAGGSGGTGGAGGASGVDGSREGFTWVRRATSGQKGDDGMTGIRGRVTITALAA